MTHIITFAGLVLSEGEKATVCLQVAGGFNQGWVGGGGGIESNGDVKHNRVGLRRTSSFQYHKQPRKAVTG